MQRQPLTPRQKEVFGFIAKSIRENGYAPTLEDIGAALSLSSLATTHKHLENLRVKGWIIRR